MDKPRCDMLRPGEKTRAMERLYIKKRERGRGREEGGRGTPRCDVLRPGERTRTLERLRKTNKRERESEVGRREGKTKMRRCTARGKDTCSGAVA